MKKEKKSKNLTKNTLLYIFIISLILFIFLAFLVSIPSFITRLDLLISKQIPTLWNPILNNIMLFITNIASIYVLTALTIILALFFLLKKKYKNFLFIAIAMILGLITELSIKAIIHRIRPEDAIIEFTRFSFPSGHAEMSLIFFTILILTIKDYIKNKTQKTIFISANILLILLIGFSRIYLNLHWFSDVIAGYLLGITIVTIVYMVLMRKKYFALQKL